MAVIIGLRTLNVEVSSKTLLVVIWEMKDAIWFAKAACASVSATSALKSFFHDMLRWDAAHELICEAPSSVNTGNMPV